MKIIRFVGIAITASAILSGQTQPSGGDFILRSNTRVVEIDVSVRDPHGKPVNDLNRSDFTVTDNGKPREFSIFNPERITPAAADAQANAKSPELPPNTFSNTGPAAAVTGHSTALLIDAINAWFDNVAYTRQAVLNMLPKIPADERIALYVETKHKGLTILQDYTTDRAGLKAAIGKYIPEWTCPAPGNEVKDEGMLRPPSLPGASHGVVRLDSCKDPLGVQDGVDSIRTSLNALAAALKDQPGRKSVFWITQGFPPELMEMDRRWQATIAALNDANIAVNTVDSNGLGGPARLWGLGGTLTMIELAEKTGGQAFHHRNDLDVALTQGIVDSRSSYTLGFYLTGIDGKYHELKVSVNRPGVQLNYRQGYNATDEPKSPKTDISAAMLNSADATGIGIMARVDARSGKPQGTFRLRLRLDPESLSVTGDTAGKAGRVEELFLALDAGGRIVGRISEHSRFNFTPDKQGVFEKGGVTLDRDLQLPPQAARLSIIVQDTGSGRRGTLTVPLRSAN